MKRFFILFLFVVSTSSAFAQTYNPDEAAKKIGDSIRVCGKIYGGRFFETSNGSPTLLNMGAAYPASPLTIMIPGDVRIKLGYAPEQKLKDKNVCVLGKVILFKEKPEIIVYSISQIQEQ
ncbi:MAG: hypothetical protein ACKVOM_10200 [Ferruginibacter sp.]